MDRSDDALLPDPRDSDDQPPPATAEAGVKSGKKGSKKPTTAALAEADVVVAAPAIQPAVLIQSLWPGKVKLQAPSGNAYEWPEAGASVIVTGEDVEFVMGKNRSNRRVCCGGSGERMMFQYA